MTKMRRPVAILVAAAIAGGGLWLAGHWDAETTGGYWAMLGVVALAGILVALAQLSLPDTSVRGMLGIAFLPMLIVAGWILVAAQPQPNTYRDHAREWNNDLGFADVVNYLDPFVFVFAFGLGLVVGLSLLAGYTRRRMIQAEPVMIPPPAYTPTTVRAAGSTPTTATAPAAERFDRRDADEPTAAERAETEVTAQEEAASKREPDRTSRLDRLLHR
jgi:hypothetical protein